ncbi:MAG: YidC/Oxa1 family membrane protein insertase [Dehalococcoidia bacterium]|nr:YidC/Oxa1 family membrane protein insertase [Dehalococcoidia bacterium]
MPAEITLVWNLVILQPMLNFLILLYNVTFSNFGVAILVFTLVIRLLMLPLTLQQLHASRKMMSIQPKMKELQSKHGKDREKISQETMKLYKEHGVNPLGCALPTLVQFPVWIGLYQSIIQALADTPDGLLALSQHLYSAIGEVWTTVPLNNHFIWLDLAKPDPLMILPVLVGGSMYVQQKMMTMANADPQQAQMNRMMQTMMPLMFAFMTLQFASGLALYWVISNLIGIALQYRVTGWGSLFTKAPAPSTSKASTPAPVAGTSKAPASAGATSKPVSKGGKKKADAKNGKKREDGRRGD